MDINQGRMVQNDILMRSLSLNRTQWVQSNYGVELTFLFVCFVSRVGVDIGVYPGSPFT